MTSKSRHLIVAAGAVLALALSAQSAAAWSCRAKSRIADGWGYSPVLQTAREEAKLKCQLNTGRRLPCRIVACTQTGPRFNLGR